MKNQDLMGKNMEDLVSKLEMLLCNAQDVAYELEEVNDDIDDTISCLISEALHQLSQIES